MPMSPSCMTCVPSCSLFPRSPGGKVILPPLTSDSGSSLMNNNAHEGRRQEAPIRPPCSCRREDSVCLSSSSGKAPLRNEPPGNHWDTHDRTLYQRRPMDAPIPGRVTPFWPPAIPPPTPVPSPQDQKTICHPTTAPAAVTPPIDPTSSQQADLTSGLKTFRWVGQTPSLDTKSSSRRSSPSDGSLKEINVTRRAKRQIYLKPDVEDSRFRLFMYVDCRSVGSQQQMDET